MRRKNAILVFVALGVTLYLAGCAKESPTSSPPPGSPSSDQEAIVQTIEADSLGEISSSDETTINDDGPLGDNFGLSKEAVAIRPLRWGRRIENISRHIDVDVVGDSIAIATITKSISGHLVIVASYQDTGHLADTVISKPFRERVQRRIQFRRIARTEFYTHNWIPVAITLVEGNVQPESVNLFTINSIEYSFPWARDTVTDPLSTWLRFRRVINGVPVLKVGDSVQVVLHVLSTDPDTERAVLRYMAVDPRRLSIFPVLGVRRVRMKLVESVWNGSSYDRTYRATFYGELGNLLFVGRFNAVVDVLSHGSLYDDAQPFSNRFWGLPYIVVPH